MSLFRDGSAAKLRAAPGTPADSTRPRGWKERTADLLGTRIRRVSIVSIVSRTRVPRAPRPASRGRKSSKSEIRNPRATSPHRSTRRVVFSVFPARLVSHARDTWTRLTVRAVSFVGIVFGAVTVNTPRSTDAETRARSTPVGITYRFSKLPKCRSRTRCARRGTAARVTSAPDSRFDASDSTSLGSLGCSR